MQKCKKSYQTQESVLKISSSPINKNKKKLKVRNIIDQNPTQQFEFINQKVRQKLGQTSNQSKQMGHSSQYSQKNHKVYYHNPYEEMYQNDLKYFREYQQNTLKYQNSGINLKWPYYFAQNNHK